MDLDRRLIKEVRNHADLYDPNHAMYKDNEHKQQIWTQISRSLIGTENESTSVAALKVRWKSLRDAYVKERRHEIASTCGSGYIKNKKPWRLKTQMEFLAPYIQIRKEMTIFESNDSSKDKPLKLQRPLNETNDQKSLKIDQKISETPTASTKPRKNMFGQTVSAQNNRQLIEINSFFRGIADAIVGLSVENQVLVQKDITNLVMNYKLRELEDDAD